MTREVTGLSVYYRMMVRTQPFDSEDILLRDLPNRKDALEYFIKPTFSLNSSGSVSVSGEYHELFVPMSLSEYCLWNVLNVNEFIQGGTFFFYADETGVLIRFKENMVHLRVVEPVSENVDWMIYSKGIMHGTYNSTDFHIFEPSFEITNNASIWEDISLPLEAWIRDSLQIAEDYNSVVSCAADLMDKSNSDYQFLAQTQATCDKYMKELPAARALFDDYLSRKTKQ